MKNLKFFAAALAIVAAASCTKGNLTEEGGHDNTSVELVEVSFPATIDSPSDPAAPESKTALASDGISVHWTEGDDILLYKSGAEWVYSSSRSSLSASTIEGSIASFSGSAVSSATYDAIYPLEVVSSGNYKSNTTHNFLVGATLSTQNVIANNFSQTSWGTSNIALASSVANGERLGFKNILAHFKFQLATQGVYRIDISAVAKDAEGASCGLGGQIAIKHSNHAVAVYTSEPIEVTNNGSAFKTGTTYYVAIPPVTMSSLTFTFKDADGNVLHTLTRSSSFTAESNRIYNLGSIELPKSYTAKTDPIQTASTLSNGKLYAIKHKGTGYWWTVQGGTLTLTEHDSSAPFADDMVFMYYNNSSAGKYPSGYNSNVVGTFRAVCQNNYYLNTSFGFTSYSSGNILYLALCNGWITNNVPESGADIDIYKVNSSSDVSTAQSYPLYWNDSSLSVSKIGLGMGNDPRKWYIYEVTEN